MNAAATMIALINFISLLAGGVLMTALYLMSARPAALEKKIGERAFKRCGAYRIASSVFMLTLTANYVLYHWFPLPFDPLPARFPWPYWVSAAIALAIALPSSALMIRSILDAKSEALVPDKSHALYGGIYLRIRHPMALGEVPLWWVFALLVDSPFMAAFSFVWLPVWFWWCVAEERDLAIRYGREYDNYRSRTGMFFSR
jgi:methanethiol S-methyltransferase